MTGAISHQNWSSGRLRVDGRDVTSQSAILLALLPIRLIQGFIYWGGGSRRFIYDPSKLDPHAHDWMANKLQSAMPGALFGTDHLIAFLLQHFALLYTALLLFSAAELVAGALLIAGLMTRAAAAASVVFSLILMAMFGWQGATCIDEWTMAACNLAMGVTLMFAGGGAYALDGWLIRKRPALRDRPWFALAGGVIPPPVAGRHFRSLALASTTAVALFVLGTYSYYRGSVFTPYHPGPTSPSRHHYALYSGALLRDGTVRIHLYLDGGTPEAPSHIVEADLIDAAGHEVEHWTIEDLSRLPPAAIRNEFAYNRVSVGPFGLISRMGAKAELTLTPPKPLLLGGQSYSVRLTTVAGDRFDFALPEPSDVMPPSTAGNS